MKRVCRLGELVDGDMFVFGIDSLENAERRPKYVCVPYPEEYKHYYADSSTMVKPLWSTCGVEVYSKSTLVIHVGTPAEYLMYLLSQE